MSKIALAFVLCFSPAILAAQAVYQCTGANGTVTYSQNPCGKDAKLIMDAKALAKHAGSGSDGEQPAPAAPKLPDKERLDPNIRAISDSVEDSRCRRDAQRLSVAPSTAKIDQANSQIAQLSSRRYVNGYGEAQAGNAPTTNQQVEQEITSLRQVISTEQAKNDSMIAESNRRVADALAECDKKKAERETHLTP